MVLDGSTYNQLLPNCSKSNEILSNVSKWQRWILVASTYSVPDYIIVFIIILELVIVFFLRKYHPLKIKSIVFVRFKY